MFLIFGLLLVGTAIQLFRHRDQDPDVEENAIVRLTRRVMPVTETYHGGRMITRIDGRRVATPLFVVLIAIGSSDLLFALDSIPAVFGVTEEAFIVFAANAFALLGLRALYFLVTGLLDRLVYLSTGLSLILAFIGVKLLLHYGHLQDDAIPEVQTSTSLLVIVVVLAITVVASLLKVAPRPGGPRPRRLAARHPRRSPPTARLRRPPGRLPGLQGRRADDERRPLGVVHEPGGDRAEQHRRDGAVALRAGDDDRGVAGLRRRRKDPPRGGARLDGFTARVEPGGPCQLHSFLDRLLGPLAQPRLEVPAHLSDLGSGPPISATGH